MVVTIMQFSQYPHQSTPRTVLLYGIHKDPFGRRHEYTGLTGGFPHEVSATDTWCMLDSFLQCKVASVIWFVNHWWHLTSSTLDLFGHVARLDPGVPARDALRLMVNAYGGRNAMASWRRPPARPRNICLNKVREDANALLLWRSEIAMGHGAPQWFTWTTRWWWWWWRMQWRRSVVKSDGGGHGSGSLRSSHQPKKPTEIRFRFRRRKWAIWSFSAFFVFSRKR